MCFSGSKSHPKGQTMVIILMIMIVALSLGITISSRYISTLRTVTTTDDGSKALSIAEALVERLLLTETEILDQYIANNSCGSNCTLEIVDTNGQRISANATLSHTGNSTNPYAVQLKEDTASEVILTGYTSGSNVSVCWNGSNSVTGLYINSSGSTISAVPYAYNAASTTHLENNFSLASASGGYGNCFTVTTSNTPASLRLKSVYGDVDAFIVPAAGRTLPSQGVQIESIGTAGTSTKKVTVTKTSPFTPAIFDYALYQTSDTDPLSN